MKVLPTFRAVVVPRSHFKPRAEDKGVGTKNENEYSVFCGREGEASLVLPQSRVIHQIYSKPGEIWIRTVGDKERMLP